MTDTSYTHGSDISDALELFEKYSECTYIMFVQSMACKRKENV